nr:hypothetical protein [Mycobacterium sp.]
MAERTHRRRPAVPAAGQSWRGALEGHHLAVQGEAGDGLGGKHIHRFWIGSVERLTISRQ